MRLLVIMDEAARLNPETDTTLILMAEAERRGHTVEVCTPVALSLHLGEVYAEAQPLIAVHLTKAEKRPAYETGAPEHRAVADYQAVLIRKDPPFDLDYYFSTLLLERVRGRALLVNDPRALRDANEKLYIFNFPRFIAETVVTRSLADLRAFLRDQGGEMIVKPLDGSGGSGVFHVRADDRNTGAILETVSDNGAKLVMAQRYLPEARVGDKRILLLGGEPLGTILRVPRPDETRGNLHVGATAARTELTPRDREIVAEVGARCEQDGLHFVGIDVIGECLTEVNVTSPTGIREIDRLEATRLEARFIDWLESRAS